MVCTKCEDKLKSVATPAPFGMGGRVKGSISDSKTGGRKINENKALSSSSRYDPKAVMRKCRICATKLHQQGSYYCQGCAYKKGWRSYFINYEDIFLNNHFFCRNLCDVREENPGNQKLSSISNLKIVFEILITVRLRNIE